MWWYTWWECSRRRCWWQTLSLCGSIRCGSCELDWPSSAYLKRQDSDYFMFRSLEIQGRKFDSNSRATNFLLLCTTRFYPIFHPLGDYPENPLWPPGNEFCGQNNIGSWHTILKWQIGMMQPFGMIQVFLPFDQLVFVCTYLGSTICCWLNLNLS